MKKLLSLVMALGLAASSFAVINPIVDSANALAFEFNLKNNGFQAPTVETYNTVLFPGTNFTLSFDDNVFSANIESLLTDPASVGGGSFFINNGPLNFGGTYSDGGFDVTWAVESTVKRRIGSDRWYGTLKATAAAAQSVPDSGTTLGLLGFGMLGLAFARRRVSK